MTFEWSTDNSSWQTSTSKAGTAVGSPVTTNNATVYFNASGFDANVSGTYYVRAKGENAAGITYSDSTSFNPWTLKTQGPTNTNGSREIPTVTPTGGSAQPVYIYEIAVVGGGGGAGYAGGGGGGTLNSYASALVTDASRNVSWTIGAGGASDFNLNTTPVTRGGTGGTTSIAGTNTTISAAGGQGAISSSPSSAPPEYISPFERALDGGGSTGYNGGTGKYDLSGKSASYAGGGGAGSGGAGGSYRDAVVSDGIFKGGNAGASVTANGLTGGGGGSGSGSAEQGYSHASDMYGKGGNGGDPTAFVYPGGASGNSGAIIFKYYGP